MKVSFSTKTDFNRKDNDTKCNENKFHVSLTKQRKKIHFLNDLYFDFKLSS